MTLSALGGATKPYAGEIPAARDRRNPAYRHPIAFESLREQFAQPDMLYAPYAFWFYDAPLDPKLAADMARKMAAKGFNPGYAHARSSAAEPYCATLAPPIPGKTPGLLPHEQWLSPLWFDTLNAALTESEKAGAYFGFSDDYWWPMGRADGRVLEAHPELKGLSLGWDVLDVQAGQGSIAVPESFFVTAVRLLDAPTEGGSLLESKTLKVIGSGEPFTWASPGGHWRLYVFKKIHQPGLDRGDVNYLDRRLAPAYIDIAYAPYESYFGKRLGQFMSGVFCDHEGSYGFKLAWSGDLETVFREKTGLDLRTWLPLLFEQDQEGRYVTIRWNWYDAVSDLYADGFFAPLNKWCEDRGMYFTGHTWETLAMQAAADGDYFKTQRAFSMPGQDCLSASGLKVREFKETQSVCEFDGKRFMSEIMGVAGWQQTPVLMKQIANAVTAWGVSHVIPHGVFLDRDLTSVPFPCDWFDENPYWNFFDLWTDFVRRASFVNSCGQLAPDVLLINPMDSVWIHTCPATFDPKLTNYDHPVLFFDLHNWLTEEVKQIEHVYLETIDTLTDSRTEYLIADRYYVDRMTVATNGALKDGGMSFRAVVLPRLTVLPLKVVEKLLAAARAGGLLLYLDQLPQGSTENGMNDPQMTRLVDELRLLPNVKHCALKDLPGTIEQTVPSQIAFEDGGFPMLQSHRRIDGRDYFWLVNNEDQGRSSRLRIRDVRGECSIWNCESGTVTNVPSEPLPDGGIRVNLRFEPCEAFWLVIGPESKRAAQTASVAPSPSNRAPTAVLDGPWRVRIDRSAQNPLTPDSLPFYCVDWTASWLDVSQNRLVRQAFTLPDNPVDARLFITSDEGFRLWVNGRPIKSRFTDDLWSQVSIYDITQLLQAGNNVIAVDALKGRGLIFQGSVKCANGRTVRFHTDGASKSSNEESEKWFMDRFDSSRWTPAPGLGVPPVDGWIDVPGKWLAPEGVETPLAPWREWGLAAFSGFVDYDKTFSVDAVVGDEMLDLGQVKHVAEVWVNGQSVGRRMWPPFRFAIGHALKNGPNTIRVRVGNLIANVMNAFDRKGKLRDIQGVPHCTEADLESGLFGPVSISVGGTLSK